MGGAGYGVQGNVVPLAAPGVPGVAQQVVDLVGLVRVQSPRVQGDVNIAALRGAGVQVDHHQYDIGEVGGMLAVAQQVIIVRGVEPEVEIAVQRRVFPAGPVDPPDEVPEAIRPFDVPVLDFVLLRVQVFLAARLPRFVLTQLEGRPVDAVVLGQKLGRKKSLTGVCVSSVRYSVRSFLWLRQVK